MTISKDKFNYEQSKIEIEDILQSIRDNDLNIDEMIIKYKRADELIKKMNTYLKTVKNSIKEIK